MTMIDKLNINRSRMVAVLAIVMSVLAIFAALAGILDDGIYDQAIATGIHSEDLMPGTLSQDIVSVAAAALLILLAVAFLSSPSQRVFVVMLGLSGHFFYGYGLYAIQGLYTSVYLAYLAVFGLSTYILIYGLTSFESEAGDLYRLSGRLRKSIAAFLFLIVLVFVPLWLAALIPHTTDHTRPEVYGVFVLDLCLIMPALGLIGIQLVRNRPFGNILAGVALVWVVTLILSVALGESFAPLYDMSANYGMIAIYGAVVTVSLALSICYLRNLRRSTAVRSS